MLRSSGPYLSNFEKRILDFKQSQQAQTQT